MRQSSKCLAADFKQKSRWTSVWPNMHYGAMYLPYSVGRQLPMRGVNWVTRDSNRLINFSDRYASVIKDLDVKRNEEELKIPLTDVRWNDHRRIYWRCSFCGSSYRKNVAVRIKYHAGCSECKRRFTSEVLQEQTKCSTLKETNPALAQQLAAASVAEAVPSAESATEGEPAAAPGNAAEVYENIAGLPCTSKFNAEWKCAKCGGTYRATIRSRTGMVHEGQATLHRDSAAWNGFCPSCRWEANLAPLATKILQRGQYLGLDVEEEE